MHNLKSIVIDHIVDTVETLDFDAYAVATMDIKGDRIGGILLRELDKLDWDEIQSITEDILKNVL